MTSAPADISTSATDILDQRRVKASLYLIGCTLVLLIAIFLSLSVGATGFRPFAVFELFHASLSRNQSDAIAATVLLDIRLPRTLLAAFVGAALAVSGAIMQGLFRNPLADPGIIGVSAGAALAAAIVIVLGETVAKPVIDIFGPFALPIAAFLGGLTTTLILVSLISRHGYLGTAMLLLAGIAIAAFALACMGLLAFVSDDQTLRDMTLWQLGSLSGSSWVKVTAVLPFAVLLILVLPTIVRGLDGLLLGEAEAFHLGVNVEKTKYIAILVTAAAVGAAVAVAGIIGFLGIVVPHAVRLLVGPGHAQLLPLSAIAGSALLIVADTIARVVAAPAELPIGIVMAFIGAPIFLHLILERRSGL